jgi:uncharacterized protein
MERDVETVAEIYRACARGDLASALMAMADEVEVSQSAELPWGGRYAGRGGFQEFLVKIREQLDSRVVLEQFIDAGEKVVAVGRTLGKARHTQLEFDVPIVHVWTFKEGLVVRFESYIDNATMLAALRG